MSKKTSKSLIAFATALMSICFAVDCPAHAQDGKHHWLFPNHPKLRRITKAAGFGVVTGGLAAPFLGASAASGAMLGATEHATVRGVKDHRDIKKHKKLDNHFW